MCRSDNLMDGNRLLEPVHDVRGLRPRAKAGETKCNIPVRCDADRGAYLLRAGITAAIPNSPYLLREHRSMGDRSFTPEQQAGVQRVRSLVPTSYYEIMNVSMASGEDELRKAYKTVRGCTSFGQEK